MNRERLESLFRLYLEGKASDEERREFLELVRHPDARQTLEELALRYPGMDLSPVELPSGISEQILTAVLSIDSAPARVRRISFRYGRVAAAVLLLVTGAALFFFLNRGRISGPVARAAITNRPPGHKGALLKLGNGSLIDLDNTKEGLVARDGDLEIYKDAEGGISYKGTPAGTGQQYNEVVTANGQELMIKLPDASTVWLNAASRIRYPLRFSAGERRISMTGEAYFKVKHDAASPFRIETKGAVIEDLGTEFNVNAYDDEANMRTTLIQGSARVNTVILRPGEQYTDGKIEKVDTEDIVAWREGMFRFHSMDIRSIMRQVARWYNIEVTYEGNINETFGGGISRNVNLSELLQTLELTKKIKFETDGRKIIVRPYRN